MGQPFCRTGGNTRAARTTTGTGSACAGFSMPRRADRFQTDAGGRSRQHLGPRRVSAAYRPAPPLGRRAAAAMPRGWDRWQLPARAVTCGGGTVRERWGGEGPMTAIRCRWHDAGVVGVRPPRRASRPRPPSRWMACGCRPRASPPARSRRPSPSPTATATSSASLTWTPATPVHGRCHQWDAHPGIRVVAEPGHRAPAGRAPHQAAGINPAGYGAVFGEAGSVHKACPRRLGWFPRRSGGLPVRRAVTWAGDEAYSICQI